MHQVYGALDGGLHVGAAVKALAHQVHQGPQAAGAGQVTLQQFAWAAEGDQPAVPAMSRWDAILDACHKRARPIVMTTIAMGAGMLPIAVGWGAADASFRSPMAIAVIGGLLTSTVLSLLVIPVVFTYLDDLGQWSGRMYRKLTQARSKA